MKSPKKEIQRLRKQHRFEKQDLQDEKISLIRSVYLEFIQLEVQKAKRTIKFKGDVVVILNKEHWNELFPERIAHDGQYGQVIHIHNYIFVNSYTTRNLKMIAKAIWHEVIHLKHPSWNEKQTKKETEKYIK